jgi:hypothetical protein
MGKRTGVVLLFTLVVAGSIAAVPATGANEGPKQTPTIESARASWESRNPDGDFDFRVGYHTRFRDQFDFLQDSDDVIAAVMAVSPTNDAPARWGLEMTDDEFREMVRRDRIQRELPSLAAAAVTGEWSEELVEGLEPEGSFGAFAGRWIDQQNGGKLVVALASNHPDYRSARDRVETGHSELMSAGRLDREDVLLVEVAFTADDLHRVNRDFARAFMSGVNPSDMAPMSASMAPVRNLVELHAEPSALPTAETFAANYPEGLVEVVPVPEGSLSGSDDLRPRDDWGAGNWHSGAGIKVYDGNLNFLGTCMWGATVRTNTYVYMVTAAHCLGYSNGSGVVAWYNDSASSGVRRGIKTHKGNDWITDRNDGYVVVYHGSRGDLARLAITETQNVADYDCYLESETWCSRWINRREATTETEIGDVKCVAFGKRDAYVCGVLYSNDVAKMFYDFLRGIDTDSNDHSQGGDSGAGWKEATLLTGINKGHFGYPTYNTYFTHAYYIESQSHLDADAVCGTSGLCNGP